jgi:hypothetical protein
MQLRTINGKRAYMARSGLGEIIDNSGSQAATEAWRVETVVGSLMAMKPDQVLHVREDGTEITVDDLRLSLEARRNDPELNEQVKAVLAEQTALRAGGDTVAKALAKSLPIEK